MKGLYPDIINNTVKNGSMKKRVESGNRLGVNHQVPFYEYKKSIIKIKYWCFKVLLSDQVVVEVMTKQADDPLLVLKNVQPQQECKTPVSPRGAAVRNLGQCAKARSSYVEWGINYG